MDRNQQQLMINYHALLIEAVTENIVPRYLMKVQQPETNRNVISLKEKKIYNSD